METEDKVKYIRSQLTHKQERRLRLGAKNWTYERIAELEGFSFQAIQQSVQRAEKKIKKSYKIIRKRGLK